MTGVQTCALPISAIGRAVVPVMFTTPRETMAASQHLLENGVYVPPIVQIGVPKDQPRLRFFISASHTEEDIRNVVDLLVNRPVIEDRQPAIASAG